MATKKKLTKAVNKTSGDVEILKETETVVVFKVTRKITPAEHEELSKRVRSENEKSGVKVVLAPYSVDEAEVKT